MSFTGRRPGDFEYKTRLLGILPRHFNNPEGPWKTKNLKVCKKPSQYNNGQLDVAGHPTLVGSGIVERRFGLQNAFLNESSDEEDESDGSHDGEESSLSSLKNEDDKSNDIEDAVEAARPATRFVASCFNPLKDSPPDFVSERLALIYLAVEETAYILKARKYCFTSKLDPESKVMEAIELKFMDLPSITYVYGNNEYSGPQFVRWATKDDDQMSTPMKTMDISGNSPDAKDGSGSPNDSVKHDDNDGEDDGDEVDDFPYHYAFVEGELTKHSGPNRSRKFTVHMCALIGGVWNSEENPEQYTCSHLAEMRTANEKTVRSLPHSNPRRSAFYKRIRMKRNWFQAHLAGEKNYLVGINGVDSKRHRIVKELWLYDVDKIPRAIEISADDEGFIAWTPEKLHHRLFTALEFIQDTMKNAVPDQEFIFIHSDKPDYLYYDHDGSVMKTFVDSKSKLMLRGLPKPPSSLGLAEMKSFDEEQLITVLKCVGYFRGESLPTIARIKYDLELTFSHAPLAEAFLKLVKTYWCNKQNIPPGFEKLWIEPRSVDGPHNFKGTGVALNQPQQQHQQNRFTYDNRSNYYNNNGSTSYGGRSSFGNQEQQRSAHQSYNHGPSDRTRTFSDSDDNWRK